jgi:hypothetical protein
MMSIQIPPAKADSDFHTEMAITKSAYDDLLPIISRRINFIPSNISSPILQSTT